MREAADRRPRLRTVRGSIQAGGPCAPVVEAEIHLLRVGRVDSQLPRLVGICPETVADRCPRLAAVDRSVGAVVEDSSEELALARRSCARDYDEIDSARRESRCPGFDGLAAVRREDDSAVRVVAVEPAL